MEAELRRIFWIVTLVVIAGAMAFVARYYLSWRLRRKLPKGLVPVGRDLVGTDAIGRFVSLRQVGHQKRGARSTWLFRVESTP